MLCFDWLISWIRAVRNQIEYSATGLISQNGFLKRPPLRRASDFFHLSPRIRLSISSKYQPRIKSIHVRDYLNPIITEQRYKLQLKRHIRFTLDTDDPLTSIPMIYRHLYTTTVVVHTSMSLDNAYYISFLITKVNRIS